MTIYTYVTGFNTQPIPLTNITLELCCALTGRAAGIATRAHNQPRVCTLI